MSRQGYPIVGSGASAQRSPLANLCRRWVLSRLSKIQRGAVVLNESGRRVELGQGGEPDLTVNVQIRSPRFYTSLLSGGSIGAGESYARGEWNCDRLADLVRILALNRATLEGLDSGLSKLAAPFLRLAHSGRRNTRPGSRRNIAAHYDLGNDFYRLFLDPTMNYSCAIFERPDSTLEEASIAKMERICRKLNLSPQDHLLEIGTGWGGLAIHAASRYGCRVTTTTISRNQWEFARAQIAGRGLQNRVEVLLRDYRDLTGRYDKLVSIEMIEAVGHHYFDTYFQRCAELLQPDGQMLLQSITIADQNYLAARDSVDFIKRHIFPGSCIPSVTALCDSITRCSDLRLFHLEDITVHYARTLAEWARRFRLHRDEVLKMGFSREFVRLWEFYFAYCEGGFAERAIGDVQMLLTKPLCRREPILGRVEGILP